MRKLWLRSLALSLGLLATGARAQEVNSLRAPAPPDGAATPAFAPGKPIAIATSRPAAPAAPAAVIGRPIAVADTPRLDALVQPVTFSAQRDPRAPVVRAASAEPSGARPMPVGPGGDAGVPGMHSWRRDGSAAVPIRADNAPGAVLSGPTLQPSGSIGAPIAGTPIAGTPIAGAPIAGTPIVGPAGAFPGPTVISGPGVIASGGDCCAPGVQGHCGSGWGFGGHCGAGGCCPGAPRFLLGAEYLMWWMKGDNTPPLLSSSPSANPTGTFLGDAGSNVLYGGNQLGKDGMSGLRITGQWWFSEDHCWGLDVGAFFIGSGDEFDYGSFGEPRLGRPIFDRTPFIVDRTTGLVVANPRFNQGNAELIAGLSSPNTVGTSGSFNAKRTSTLWGYDVALRRNLLCSDTCYMDAIIGYRQLALDEKLSIGEQVFVVSPAQNPSPLDPPVGTLLQVNDSFSTSNRFYGAVLGLDTLLRKGNWTLGLRGKVGLGVTEQIVTISGSTTVGGISLPGGLLALDGTNIGRTSRKMFGVVPEVGMTIGYDVKEWWRIFAGYNLLYWNSVVRPGEQINLNVNRSYQPGSLVAPTGSPEPQHVFRASDFWAHGVSLGMEFRF